MKQIPRAQNLCASIDVGTTKICVLIGRQLAPDALEIIGIGKAASEGLSRGIVIDISAAMHSIKSALQEAQLMAGVTIESAYVGISGAHIQSSTSQGMVPVKKGEVRPYDIEHVIAAAKAVPLPHGQEILHVLPQFFTLDSQNRIKNPLGMYGVRLEAQVSIITGATACVQNLVRCCIMAGVKVADIVLEPLASALAVLSEDERELGVGLLDIGGGTSDLALYQETSLKYAMILPIAGIHFTQDLAICLRTPLKEAERIKIAYGLVADSIVPSDHSLEIEMMHGVEKQIIPQYHITDVLSARASELFALIHDELVKRELYPLMTAGLVLTGGGALLKGMKELAESTFNIPVRIGKPRLHSAYKDALDNPAYATGYGILLHALHKNRAHMLNNFNGPLISRVFWRMKSWISDFF